jgi:type IX secretion system PorP/SprF family membrane protein
MKNTKYIILIFYMAVANLTKGQDPNFSQFFSSPLNINPALTGNMNGDWRAVANFRDQWIGPASPYMTGTISYDRKILQNKSLFDEDEEPGNYGGIGLMMMYDQAMAGVVKSTYVSLNGSYSIRLSAGQVTHRLTAGFAGIYGNRTIDFSKVNFEEQFTGAGFDTNLPTGEAALSGMKPYFSMSTGLLYTVSTEKSNLDIGVAGFHFSHPKQTFLEDKNQILPIRKVIHANFETYLNDDVVLNTNAVYQWQGEAYYYSFGGALGRYLPTEKTTMINAGVWYWSKNAITPYVGLLYDNLQFGVTYDLTISKLREVSHKPNTWELSIIIRGVNNHSPNIRGKGGIPCPWK